MPRGMSIALLQAKAEKALKKAVRKVVEEHKRAGSPLFIWREGKVVKVPASALK